ncbi:MAG: hypothetical protein RL215_864, partial [Planctomycetota bacterium]
SGFECSEGAKTGLFAGFLTDKNVRPTFLLLPDRNVRRTGVAGEVS